MLMKPLVKCSYPAFSSPPQLEPFATTFIWTPNIVSTLRDSSSKYGFISCLCRKLLLITKFGEKFLEEVEVIDTEKGVKICPLKPLGPKFRDLHKIIKELQGTFNTTDNSFLIPFTTSE